MKTPPSIPGLELSQDFFNEIAEPILDKMTPELAYTAALIGKGSEVLGFDDKISSDHHWGPRVMLFLPEEDLPKYRDRIGEIMTHQLPYNYRGYSTNFTPPISDDDVSQLLQEISSGPVNHLVEVHSLNDYCLEYLGIKPSSDLTPAVWLTIPGQKLRAFTGGAIFRDDSGLLTDLRKRLQYYPGDIWLYMLAAGWARIGQEEPFLGRTGIVNDELGSRLIGARLVHNLMNICFLIEKTYPPYSKWFGSAFKQLDCSSKLEPIFQRVLDAADWQEREKHLIRAYEFVADKHNQLKITKPLPVIASQFHNRPFSVIQADHFVAAIKTQIQDPEVKRIAELTHNGAAEQFSTSTDLLCNTRILARLREIYRLSS